MNGGLSPIEKEQKAVGLLAIADQAQKRAAAGESPLDTQTFINGARRELTRELPDTAKMQDDIRGVKEVSTESSPWLRKLIEPSK